MFSEKNIWSNSTVTYTTNTWTYPGHPAPNITYDFSGGVNDVIGPSSVDSSPATAYNSSMGSGEAIVRSMNMATPQNFGDNDNSYYHSSEEEKVSVGSGKKVDFQTTKVTFERDKLEETIVIYYDTWKGLKDRGVVAEDENYRKGIPKPFPSDRFCPDV